MNAIEQMNEDREWWFAIGYLTAGLRFNTNTVKANDRAIGWRVRTSVTWADGLIPMDEVQPALMKLMEVASIPMQDKWTTSGDAGRWVALIRHLNASYHVEPLFADRHGLAMFMWVYDNPPPSDYEEFIDWCGHYGQESEQQMNFLYKAVAKEGDDAEL